MNKVKANKKAKKPRFSVKQKAAGAFISIAVLVGIQSYISYTTIDDLDKGFIATTEDYYRNIDTLEKLKISMLTLRRHEKDFLLRDNEKYITRHSEEYDVYVDLLDDLSGNSSEEAYENLDKMADNAEAYMEGFGKVVELKKEEGNSTEGIRGKLRSIAHDLEKFIKGSGLSDYYMIQLLTFRRREKDFLLRRDAKYLAKLKGDISKIQNRVNERGLDDERKTKLFSLIEQYEKQFVLLVNNTDALNKTINDFRANIHAVEEAANELIEDRFEKLHITENKLLKEAILAKKELIGLSIAILVIIGLINVFAHKLITKINETIDNLKKLSQDFLMTSDIIDQSSGTLNNLATSQASAIQETASSVNEITAMVTKNTENAVNSKAKSEENATAANQGKETVYNVIKAMNSLSDSTKTMTTRFQKTSEELQDVVNIINQIGEKAKVINDIVFQTKLLSFNASVEAARAGEHGKGFAVVAEEVGNLATMSGTSAEEISSILDESVKMVTDLATRNQSEIENLVDSNNQKVQHGISTAKECEVALNTIIRNIENINSSIAEIAQASEEQDTGVKEISVAVNEFNSSNQQAVSMANETKNHAASIKINADKVFAMTVDLEAEIQGSKPAKKKPAKSKPKKVAEKKKEEIKKGA